MISFNRLKYRAYFRILLIIYLLVLSKPLICQNTNNLILYYPMHGNVKDMSGNGLDGIVHGATLTTDRFGVANEAYHFRGVDAYIEIPSSNLIQSYFPKTISFWFYLDDLDYYYGLFSSDYYEPAYTGFWIKLRESANGAKVISANYGDGGLVGDPAARVTAIGTTPLEKNRWYHVTAVFSGLNNMTIYLDCKLEKVVFEGTGSTLNFSSRPGSLGRHNSSNNVVPPSVYYLKGKIDEVKIFNKALSAEEVISNCKEENLFSHYSFEGLCKSRPFNFKYDGGESYDSVLWNFGDKSSLENSSRLMNPVHSFSDTGIYSVNLKVFYKNSMAEFSDKISVKDIPHINIGNDTTICEGNSLNLGLLPVGNTYKWSDGSSGRSLNVNKSGLYSVVAGNSCGQSYDTLLLSVSNIGIVYVPADTTFCINTFSTISASGPGEYQYSWEGNSNNKSYTGIYSSSKTIQLKVTTPQSCLKTFNVNIRIRNCRDDIVIPNVFTPNGDGINDFWIISNIEKYPEATIEVYSRWGTVVFRSTESRKIWDGLFNGRKVTPGTYYYSVILNNGLEAFKGPLLIFW